MNIDVGKQKHDFKKESKTDKGSEINKRKKNQKNKTQQQQQKQPQEKQPTKQCF